MDNGIEITQATSEAILRRASGLERFYATLGANIIIGLALIGTLVVVFVLLVGLITTIKQLLNRKPKVGRPLN